MHLRGTYNSTGEIIRALKQRPDEIMLEIGAGGELLVARIRLACALLLLLLPIANYFLTHSHYESMAGFLGASSAIVFSALWLTFAKQSLRRPWLGFVSSAIDITMVTGVLVILAQNQLAAALNSVVVWCCYPLAILATALRNDARVSLFAGVLAIVQFGLLSLIIMGMNDGTISSIEYGTASVSTLIQRIVLLIVITAMTVVVVFRMQRLVQLSGTDALTGLPNRLYLNHHVPQLLAAAQKQNATLSMAIIDLDLFKRVNDELGHLSGDKAIRHAVNIIRNECGKHEPMIRIGGEEFLLVISAPMGAAWERMEALRKRLEANPFEPGGQKLARILTFSAGIASTPHDANTVSDLLKIADKRLKIAKAQGRNRVIARD
jgi:two-component system, cell cycle response regulator